MKNLNFKVHTRLLIEETFSNPGTAALKVPYRLLYSTLLKVAKRASEINDPILNELMCDLTLYAISDPHDKENYDPEKVKEVHNKAHKAMTEDIIM